MMSDDEFEQGQLDDDIVELMKHEPSMRVLACWMKMLYQDYSTFDSEHGRKSAYNEGKRDAGLMIRDALLRVDANAEYSLLRARDDFKALVDFERPRKPKEEDYERY